MPTWRVALCITELDWGGAELALAELAARLDRDRFDPIVYCLGPRPDQETRSLVPRLEAAGVPVHCLGARGLRDLPITLARLAALVQQQGPHLIQSMLFHANLVSRVVGRQLGVRRVVSGIRVAEPRKWHLWADRATSGLVDRYVCVSRSVAHYSQTAGRLPEAKLVVIPNGVDVETFEPPELRPPNPGGRRWVTCVGRLTPQKGVDWLLSTAPRWLERLPDVDLILAGDGPEEGRLRRLAESLGIAERTHFLGWTPDVPALLAASELLALPSRWEGMPNIVLQAMASSRAVLASAVEGVAELLGEESDAQTVNFGDSEAWADKLIGLLSNDPLRQRLGQANRTRAEREFSIVAMVRAYEELWASLLAGGEG